MKTTYLEEAAIRNSSARAHKLRSLAVIEITRRLYGLPSKATAALAERLDQQAHNMNEQCATC